MKEANVPKPSVTLGFAEKVTGSRQVHVDFDQGKRGNDLDVGTIERQRHNHGSNYDFLDSSVRFMRGDLANYPDLRPENLWAVTDQFRIPPNTSP
jgi:pyruvate carboxylase